MTKDLLCRVEAGTQALAADFAALGAGPEGWCVQECRSCDGGCFPPRLRCPHCGSDQLAWTPVGDVATVASVIRVKGENPRHRPMRALRRPEGYATAVLTLDRWTDVRFPVLIEGEDAAKVEVGIRIAIGTATVSGRAVPAGYVRDKAEG